MENQQYNEYTLYSYLKPKPETAEFLVQASKPVDLRHYICDFEGELKYSIRRHSGALEIWCCIWIYYLFSFFISFHSHNRYI